MDYTCGLFETARKIYNAYVEGDIHPRMVWDYIVHCTRSTFSSQFETGVVVKHTHSNHLLYYDNDQKYRIVLPKRRRRNFRSIVEAYDHNDHDITELIKETLGPMNDFHGTIVTPISLGYPSVKIVYRDDTERIYYENDQILPSNSDSYFQLHNNQNITSLRGVQLE